MNRKVGRIEVLVSAFLLSLIVLSEHSGLLAQLSGLVLKAIALSFFLLFAAWFCRAVYLSARAAPDYALVGYSLLAFTLLCWGMAFFYPFPIRGWRGLLIRDLAFFAGVPAPFALMLLLASLKVLLVSGTWDRLRDQFTRSERMREQRGTSRRRHRLSLTLAAAAIGWFLVLCGTRIKNDLLDLGSQPRGSIDTLVYYFQGNRSEDVARFAKLGNLRLPHGFRLHGLKRGQSYLVLYTPHAKLLVGFQPRTSAIETEPRP